MTLDKKILDILNNLPVLYYLLNQSQEETGNVDKFIYFNNKIASQISINQQASRPR